MRESSVRFAHEDKDLIAVASMDGTISICSTFDNPSVLAVLKGHTRGVTGNNDHLPPSPGMCMASKHVYRRYRLGAEQ
jgi:hypothetical protein